MAVPVLRVARPTDRLAEVATFYREALGFERLASFRGHDGWDGEVLGFPGASWHVELVSRTDGSPAAASPAAASPEGSLPPSEEHLLAIYFATPGEYEEALARAARAGAHSVPSHNPYWDRLGRTFTDPDGWRIVLVNSPWPRPVKTG
jgi:uncharacterized glyoxalase superfamily protein PhnB